MFTRFYTPPPSALYTMSGFQTKGGGGGAQKYYLQRRKTASVLHMSIFTRKNTEAYSVFILRLNRTKKIYGLYTLLNVMFDNTKFSCYRLR